MLPVTQSSPRVLCIEDDEGVATVVRTGLNERGFRVDYATTLADGRRQLDAREYEAIILDLVLPDGSGLDLASSLREQKNDVPILILTAQNAVQDRVAGLQRGADDYLCKPFDIDELAARLSAILRRTSGSDRHVLRYADVELDLITRVVRRGSISAVLSGREAELLAYLMRHPEEVLHRDRILSDVWGDEAEGDRNVLNVYINYLRNKLEHRGRAKLIRTVRGEGYALRVGDLVD